jgi:hypothetical protein
MANVTIQIDCTAKVAEKKVVELKAKYNVEVKRLDDTKTHLIQNTHAVTGEKEDVKRFLKEWYYEGNGTDEETETDIKACWPELFE